MKKIIARFKKLISVSWQYPLLLLIAFLSSIALILSVKTNDFIWNKIGVVCITGIPLIFALIMLEQRLKKKFIFQFLGLLFLIGFYFLLFREGDQKSFTEIQTFIILVVFILYHLLVAFIAYFRIKNQRTFWEYNKSLFVHIVLAVLFSGVLVLGIELALAAIENLFQLNFITNLHLYVAIFISCFGSCFIFLIFIGNGLPTLEESKPFPMILKFFVKFILIPLLIVYSFILYVYFFKIIFSWELPRGWISYMIIAYSLLGIITLLLVYPLKKDIAGWVQVFQKCFYYTLIPLIILLIIAISKRISDYGITENRYYVLLLTIWLTLIVSYFIFKKAPNISFIPKSLFLLGILSLTLPFINIFSTSERSQFYQFYKILQDNQLLKNEKINFASVVQDSIVEEITDKVKFFATRKKLKKITPLFEKETHPILDSIHANPLLYYRVRSLFTHTIYKKSPTDTKDDYSIRTSNFNQKSIYVKGYTYACRFFSTPQSTFLLEKDSLKIIQKKNSINIELIQDEKSVFYNLKPFVKKTLTDCIARKITEIQGDRFIYEFDLSNYHFKLLISNMSQSISLEKLKTQQKEKQYKMSGLLLSRRKRKPSQALKKISLVESSN